MSLIWLTGLSGAGKSTIASELHNHLNCSLLDGDTLRETILKEHPHGMQGREERLALIIKVALAHLQRGDHVVAAFVSPKLSERLLVRQAMERENHQFIEVHVQASYETCAERDVKGLYRRAKEGEDIKLAGLTEPYEMSDHFEVICDTENSSISQCAQEILAYIRESSQHHPHTIFSVQQMNGQ